MSVKIGNIVKLYIILLLNEKPVHGYDLMKSLKEKLGVGISASQVYPFLSILAKNRLVAAEKTGGRERKVYRLTAGGKKFVRSQLQRFGDLIHGAIEPKLSVCAHCGCKVYEGGYTETIRGKKTAFCCPSCASSFKKSYL